MIIESIEKIESIAILNDIEIKYSAQTKLKLSLDKGKIIRALLNILSNSLKYTKDVVCIETEESGYDFKIIIKDNGDGFEQHILENLFKKNVIGKKDGSGLGLSIVKEIIEKHGGKLEIKNLIIGAEYTLILPKNL